MKHLVIDLDGTLTIDQENVAYKDKKPNLSLIEKLKEYRKNGFQISIFTARNMRTYNGDIEKLKNITLPSIIEWLDKHNVPYDDVIVGKVWCGFEGFYVDDKAIRPSEFIHKNYEEILNLLANEKAQNLNKPQSNKTKIKIINKKGSKK